MKSKGWRDLWVDPTERWVAIFSFLIAVLLVAITSQYLLMIEKRQGVVLADPIHAIVGPVDLTWLIFFVLYGALLMAFAWLWNEPKLIFQGFRAYAILLTLRMIGIWLLPLDPPPNMIPMPDPIIQSIASTHGELLTRDLFFSGHTSSLFMAAFIMPTTRQRWFYIILGTVVGASLILQHVHYSVDVMVAPMASLMAVALSGRSK
jgi:membrane-associated phospholipid phosphatase